MEEGRRPGDKILDRHCSHLTHEEREEAHARLRALARVLIGTDRRVAERDVPTADSTQSGPGSRIPSLPTS